MMVGSILLVGVSSWLIGLAPPPPAAPPPVGVSPHPRLRLTEPEVDRLRETLKTDHRAAEIYAEIEAHVATILSSPLPGSAADVLCDTIRDHMYSVGLVYRLTTNRTRRAALAAWAAAELELTVSAADWVPRRFLTVAETMHGVAIGYDWFYHDLPAATRTTVEDGLVRLGIRLGLGCWHQNCSWVPGIASTGACQSCWWTEVGDNPFFFFFFCRSSPASCPSQVTAGAAGAPAFVLIPLHGRFRVAGSDELEPSQQRRPRDRGARDCGRPEACGRSRRGACAV